MQTIMMVLFFCIVWFHTASSFAQSMMEEDLLSIYGDEEFITIATGSVQPLSKAPAVASIITAEDIKRLGAKDIDDVLRTVPGLHVSYDTLGFNPIYTFRGIYSSFNPQVLMLVDGMPLTNLFHGDRSQFWGGMPVEAISRIEVIRGPGSALYGSDAFAGVINIITKNASNVDEGFTSGLTAGSYDRYEGWVSGRKDFGDVKLVFTGEYSQDRTEYGRIDVDSQAVLDSFIGTSASLAPGQATADRERVDIRMSASVDRWLLNAGHQYRSGDGSLGIAESLVVGNRFVSNRTNVALGFEDSESIDDWNIKGTLSYLHTTVETRGDIMLFPPGSAPFLDDNGIPVGVFIDGVFGNPETYEHHFRGDFSAQYSGFLGHQLTFGAGYYHGDLYKVRERKNYGVDPATGAPIAPIGFDAVSGLPIFGRNMIDVSDTPLVFLQGGTRKNRYFFVQDIWEVASGWELTAGLRYDDYSDFGSTVNPRAALVWSTARDLTTKFLYGQAFRAPAFAQTRAINNPSVLGNPDLDPETLHSYEIAFDYRPRPNINLLLNVFYYEWEDIINFVPDANELTRTAQNSGEQVGKGVELEANWKVTPSWTLSGNFAYTSAEDRTTGADAASFPTRQLYLRSFWSLDDGWSVNLQASHVGDRRRAHNDPRRSIDDYTLVDLTVRKTITPAVQAALLIKNLLDEDAREPTSMADPVPAIPNDLPLPGRTILGELRFSF